MRVLRIILLVAASYPLWGFVYETVTGRWPPHWMQPRPDPTAAPPCLTCGGGAPG